MGFMGTRGPKIENYSWMDGRVDGQMKGQKGWKKGGREGGGKVGGKDKGWTSILFSAVQCDIILDTNGILNETLHF
jgi:hypothetical protein